MASDTLYLWKREIKASFQSLPFYLWRLRPIQRNKIVFMTIEGTTGFTCNPKYIALELLRRNKGYELVWLVNDMRKQFPPYIRKASNTLLSRAYEYATARVWVDCHRKPFGTRKQAGQHYLQTFHCDICFKPLGADRGGKMPRIAEMVSEADSALIDLWLTSSKWNEDMVRRAMYYHGPVERVGSPRCDILFHGRASLSPRIREHFGIPQDAQILLFAPTFRAGSQTRHRTVEAEQVALDFQQVLDALEARTGHPWYLMLRLHPQVAAHMEKYPLAQNVRHVVDASQYGDAYELLAAADALLTDYSSLAFDASFVHLPVFLYADDLAAYQADRNKLYFDMYHLPFPFAETQQALLENIQSFDKAAYDAALDAFLRIMDTREDGHACERAERVIEAWMTETFVLQGGQTLYNRIQISTANIIVQTDVRCFFVAIFLYWGV